MSFLLFELNYQKAIIDFMGTSSSIERLQKELQESKKHLHSVQSYYKHDTRLLIQYVLNLASSLRNLHPDLDPLLDKINGLHRSPKNMSIYKDDFERINLIIKKQCAELHKDIIEAHQRMQRAAQHLLHYDALTTKTRHELQELIESLQQPTVFPVASYMQRLSHLLHLYQQSTHTTHATEKHTEACYLSFSSLKEEILNILSSTDFGISSSELSDVKQLLLDDIDYEIFMSSCVKIIRLIVHNLKEERLIVFGFLHETRHSLGGISDTLERSILSFDENLARHSVLDRSLTHNLDKIQKLCHQYDLQHLTQDIEKQIVDIRTSLAKKQQLTKVHHSHLTEELGKALERVQELEKETENYREKLNEQKSKGLTDTLTRLPNKDAFHERLALEFYRWQRYEAPLSIAIADIDTFKRINTAYGHIAGDKTIQVIANMLKKSLRNSDFVARYDGEEFFMIFPQSILDDVVVVLERAQEHIHSIPFRFKGNDVRLTVSIGATAFNTNDTIEQSVQRAFSALDKAQEKGQNSIHVIRSTE